jgi:glycolate oxidase FAD binding subunit
MSLQTETVADELRAIVGDQYFRHATPADTIDGVAPRYIIEPGNADEVAQVLHCANDAGLHIAPRGGGSKLAWGNRPRGVDLVLSTKRLNRVLEHAWGDMTATVEAGCTVGELQRVLAEHGQRLALDPLWPERTTVGGLLSTNDSGALRIRVGSLRDLIIGITVALPDGTLARSGGKVVKNVAGYDLPKLMTGAFGTLGVITEATFRLYPLPRDTRTFSFRLPTAAAMNQLVLQVLDSTLVSTGLQVRAGSDHSMGVDVRFEGISAALDAQATRLNAMAAAVDAQSTASADVWNAREALWSNDSSAVVCKLTFLPANLAAVIAALERVATPLRIDWQLVAQAVGTAMLRLDASNSEAALAALTILRAQVQRLEGSLVVLQCAADVKARIDVWGYTGDALPLMQRVKERFDPNGTLNRGRFLGF